MENALAGDIFNVQQRLRRRILDQQGTVTYRPAKDLAAYLLLALDDNKQAWRTSTAWLCDELGVERVDGGYARPDDTTYLPGQSETVCEIGGIPSCKGITVDNGDRGVRAIWNSSQALIFPDIVQDARFGLPLRQALMQTGTRSKIAMSLSTNGRPFGLLCADRICSAETVWSGKQLEIFETVGREVLAPILGAFQQIHYGLDRPDPSQVKGKLTDAEWKVAELAALGLSYKEIATRLNKSVHTIDHQLRGVRRKLNLTSHSKLVQFLNHESEAAQRSAA